MSALYHHTIPALPVERRQGNPLDANNPTPYYLECFLAWFHNHADGSAGMLVQVRHSVLQCEHCGERWQTQADPDWVIKRERRVPEVLTRIRETENPWLWLCPEKSRHDGTTYKIRFDTEIHRWTCTCRDWRDFQDRFWGGCKHVRAVKKSIAMFIADHSEPADAVARRMVASEIQPIEPTLDDQLPVGRPINGRGWRGTLLTRSQNGMTYLEVQGVIHTSPMESAWDDISERGFEVTDECVWIDIAHDMGSEVFK
jgi:hypothetical protein